MSEKIEKCSNFVNCGNSWKEDYDNAYQFCSQECKDYYNSKELKISIIDKLLNKAYEENQWDDKK